MMQRAVTVGVPDSRDNSRDALRSRFDGTLADAFPFICHAAAPAAASTRRVIMRTSARNQFAGQIGAVKPGAVNDEVTLRTQDGLEIVAVITHGSAASLGLAAGTKAFALVKASSVIVMVDVDSSKVSARNCVAGTVASVAKGAVNSEVVIKSAGGAEIVAIVTNDSVDRLGLASGTAASAIFKASSVIVGVE